MARGPVISEFALGTLEQIADKRSGELTLQSRLDRDLELESIQLVEFQIALEEAFDVELDALTMIDLNSVDRIVAYVAEAYRTQHGSK